MFFSPPLWGGEMSDEKAGFGTNTIFRLELFQFAT